MFKKLRCQHNNKQTITNIYGDQINHLNARSVSICIDCGKRFYNSHLDETCKRSNEFGLKEFVLVGKELADISDGSHTFNELYYHRMILFSIICNTYKDKAWRSWRHNDGTMYNDYFIVGITTPKGDYSYHYHKDYWNKFDKIKLLDTAPEWDGHKPEDIDRLLSLIY